MEALALTEKITTHAHVLPHFMASSVKKQTSVSPTLVRMAEHAWMECTVLPVFVQVLMEEHFAKLQQQYLVKTTIQLGDTQTEYIISTSGASLSKRTVTCLMVAGL